MRNFNEPLMARSRSENAVVPRTEKQGQVRFKQEPNSASTGQPVRAAQYLRMSTEHQQYSTENQRQIVEKYAESKGMEIVRTYSDDARSGLNIEGRGGLRDLINEVERGDADFSEVLVYDVSRWGRFQDVDESAYYEYKCKRANVRIHYCAEQFENDGSLSSTLLKTIKRTMAGEYSRELSVKVFNGQCRLVELGFRQGGPAGYGLRRQLIDKDRNAKHVLSRGEQKSIQTDRVILVPGPEEEIRVVREIYDRFTQEGSSEMTIAELLNSRGICTDLARPWTRATIHRILTSPKYAGANVFNRKSYKLKRKRVSNPPEMWIRLDNAFTPIISAEQFAHSLAIVQSRDAYLTDEQLLDRLRLLLSRMGSLSGILIDEADDMPSSSTYEGRFGGLSRVYALIGYTPRRDLRYIELNRQLRKYHNEQCALIIAKLRQDGAIIEHDGSNGLLEINQEFTASLAIARCRETFSGKNRWVIRLDNSLEPDVTIAARLKPGNQEIKDFYLFPKIAMLSARCRLSDENGILLDAYRFENLDFFHHMVRRVPIERVS
jgi:DNA invertase Pin-like site-specific DNA recombinase